MRIWLGTWNVEQRFPTNLQIWEWLHHANGTAGAYINCDIVAMTFQEAARNHVQPPVAGFVPLNHLTALGQTKNKENCQALFIWQAAGLGATVGQGETSVTERTFKRKVKFWAEYGKGSCSQVIWHQPPGAAQPWRVVVSGAHLDSKDAGKRTAQVRAAEASAAALLPGAQGLWDVQFLMGDLNFRVDKHGGTWARDNFYDTVANHRHMLFGNDSLVNDPVLGAGGDWTFPDPVQGVPGPGATLQLPSYKRWYKTAHAAAQARAAAQLLTTNPAANAARVPDLFDIGIDKNGHVKEGGRAGQFDLGWLDRIGYRIKAGCGRTVTPVYLGSAAELVVSDHAPVYGVFDIA